MAKRVREDLTSVQVAVLEKAWIGGVKTAGSKEISSLATLTGLREEKVKVWIGNRRAKERCRPTGSCRPKVPYSNGPNGYSYFCGKIPRGDQSKETYFKMCGNRWKNLSKEEQSQFKMEAEIVRQDPNKGCDRKVLFRKHMSIINKSCDILETAGFVIGGFSLDSQKHDVPVLFGTPKGIDWLASKNSEIISNILGTTETSNQQEDRKSLRHYVQKKFESCWVVSSGLKKPIPYKAISEKKIDVEVHGLPEGISFKNPTMYSLPQLKKILSSTLKFEVSVRPKTSTASAPQEPEVDTTVAANSILEELANGGQNLVTEDVSGNPEHYQAEGINNVLEETSDQANVLIINKPETDDIPVAVVRHRKRKRADQKIASKNKNKLSADVYIQEKIMKKRKIGKRTEYLVKWEGFDSSDNTWEPKEHFLDQTLINEFNHLKK